MTEERNIRTVVRDCARLSREQRTEEALTILRHVIRTGQLLPEEIEAAGRLLGGMFTGPRMDFVGVNVLIVGQCTTSWLVQTLTAIGWGHGIAARVQEGAYDTVIQDLAGLSRPVRACLIPGCGRKGLLVRVWRNGVRPRNAARRSA